MITPQALVNAGLYPNEQKVIQEAMRILWQERPKLRIDWAIHQYQTDEIERRKLRYFVSLAKAATIAGVSFDRMNFIERAILYGCPAVHSTKPSPLREKVNIGLTAILNHHHF